MCAKINRNFIPIFRAYRRRRREKLGISACKTSKKFNSKEKKISSMADGGLHAPPRGGNFYFQKSPFLTTIKRKVAPLLP